MGHAGYGCTEDTMTTLLGECLEADREVGLAMDMKVTVHESRTSLMWSVVALVVLVIGYMFL